MSQELERVYTINLGKVLLTPDNQRAKRAINMIREFARHHMKTEEIKIEEDVAHQIWSRGIKHPPRKIRVRLTKTDEGYVLVSQYDEEIESAAKPAKEKEAVEEKVTEEVTKETPKVEAEVETEPKKETKEEVKKPKKVAKEPKKEDKPKKEAKPKKVAKPKKEAKPKKVAKEPKKESKPKKKTE